MIEEKLCAIIDKKGGKVKELEILPPGIDVKDVQISENMEKIVLLRYDEGVMDAFERGEKMIIRLIPDFFGNEVPYVFYEQQPKSY